MEKRYGTPIAGDEKEVLSGFLDHYRRTLIEICRDLSDEELRRPMVPSGTSLLAILKHLAYTERGWFQENIANEPFDYPFDTTDDPDADWALEPDDSFVKLEKIYAESCAKSREVLDSVTLDDMVTGSQRSADYNVRWVVLHMIEETARHVGHADIIRELVDGRAGWGYGP